MDNCILQSRNILFLSINYFYPGLLLPDRISIHI